MKHPITVDAFDLRTVLDSAKIELAELEQMTDFPERADRLRDAIERLEAAGQTKPSEPFPTKFRGRPRLMTATIIEREQK